MDEVQDTPKREKMKTNHIYQGDSLEVLKTLPDESINMVMTSPPYWALRDYGVEGQLGLEPTFEEYINKLCDIFDEVKRVLRDDGTCWVNIGDSYAGPMGKKDGWTDNKLGFEKQEAIDKGVTLTKKTKIIHQLSQKCLVCIPMRFALEMVNRGWILRNTIIWHKPNCMPSSVKDRFTVDFEYIFFFSKKKKYYFETQYESVKQSSIERMGRKWCGSKHEKLGVHNNKQQEIEPEERMDTNRWCPEQGRNKRTVWSICPKPFKEAHFAVYPEELCETPIKAGCPEFVCVKCGKPRIKEFKNIYPKDMKSHKEIKRDDTRADKSDEQKLHTFYKHSRREVAFKREEKIISCECNANFTSGIVLDPFFGAGTTGLVALKQGKKFVGIELSKEYIDIANKRLKPYLSQQRLV